MFLHFPSNEALIFFMGFTWFFYGFTWFLHVFTWFLHGFYMDDPRADGLREADTTASRWPQSRNPSRFRSQAATRSFVACFKSTSAGLGLEKCEKIPQPSTNYFTQQPVLGGNFIFWYTLSIVIFHPTWDVEPKLSLVLFWLVPLTDREPMSAARRQSSKTSRGEGRLPRVFARKSGICRTLVAMISYKSSIAPPLLLFGACHPETIQCHELYCPMDMRVNTVKLEETQRMYRSLFKMLYWLVVWNMHFIFPNSWDDDPIWFFIFFRGFNHQLVYIMLYRYIMVYPKMTILMWTSLEKANRRPWSLPKILLRRLVSVRPNVKLFIYI